MQQGDYDLKSVKMPRLVGGVLKIFLAAMENKVTGPLLYPKLLSDAGLTSLKKLSVDEVPTFYNHWDKPKKAAPAVDMGKWITTKRAQKKGFSFPSARDYAEAYRKGRTNPEEVAQLLLKLIEESNNSDPALNAIIKIDHDNFISQARASARRWKKGKPTSIFDGVPLAVKDEVDMIPYGTSFGTSLMGQTAALGDATVVKRMRDAGALLMGKANMNEIGIGVTGLNIHYGAARNPYNPENSTGGSSSGCGAAVAAGLCPSSIGADGGGSIRIPASFCGLVGLKATFGRISGNNSKSLCWSVAHNGPIAASAEDAALLYAFLAGPDLKDPHTLHQPAVSLDRFDNFNLKNLKIGIYRPWFEHADAEMVKSCNSLVKSFEKMGALVKEISIPELEPARVAFIVTIVTEMCEALSELFPAQRKAFGPDVRTNLALVNRFTSADYLKAQRIRTRTVNHFIKAFDDVDVIVTPATGCPAPALPVDALENGESDLTTLMEIMRFSTAANFTGLPAISFPAGYTAKGLPIGMQVIGRAWEEHTLLRLAHAAEQVVKLKKPKLFYEVLQ